MFQLDSFPDEILTQILIFCDIPAIHNFSLVSKRFLRCTETDIVWRHRWHSLRVKLGITDQLNLSAKQGYRNACKRFVSIFGVCPSGQPVELTCTRCLRVICQGECMQDREEIIVFDFGSKISYFKYASDNTGQLSMHPTVGPLSPIASPPDETLSEDMAINLSCPVCAKLRRRVTTTEDSCVNEKHSKTNGNSSRISNALSRLTLRSLHCFDTSHNVDEGAALLPDNDIPVTCVTERTANGQAQTLSSNLDQASCDSYMTKCNQNSQTHPQMKIYKFLIQHMLRRNPFFQVYNIPFILCEPTGCTAKMKAEFVEFLLNDMKVPGVCFVPKPVATSLYQGLDLCLVIDSGANNTVVACVVDQTVMSASVMHKPVGGSHLTKQLMEWIKTKYPHYELDEAGIDSSQVKKECYLAYNPHTEAKRKLPAKTIHIKGSRNLSPRQYEVQLSHELYVLSEDLYLTIDYVGMVTKSIEPFNQNLRNSLLGNILLTGGNNRLNGLNLRLTKDLQAALPDSASSVRVADTRLMTGKTDALIGASYIKRWVDAQWITRSDYIQHGADCFLEENMV